jgi:molybdopterin-binding protein
MPSYTVGQAAELLGVSPDTVRRWADRRLDGAGLARYAQSKATPLGRPRAAPESARNRFPGLVTKVTKDKVMAQIEMQSGPFRVVSLISREAADELALAPGCLVVASVKSTNVVIEIPNP